MSREWNAESYNQLSAPQQAWGADVIGRLKLTGNETVVDAGCGSGKVTAELLSLLPDGQVIGIDGSAQMIELATKQVVSSRATFQVQDLNYLQLIQPVDAVLSTAAFHWVFDHENLYRRIFAALKPGGQLEAQYGGAGNIQQVADATSSLSVKEPWNAAFAGWDGPWNFLDVAQTQVALNQAGFDEVKAWTEIREVEVAPENAYAYLRTVILGGYLERLPDVAQDQFVTAVQEKVIESDGLLKLNYVRMNVSATKPGTPPDDLKSRIKNG